MIVFVEQIDGEVDSGIVVSGDLSVDREQDLKLARDHGVTGGVEISQLSRQTRDVNSCHLVQPENRDDL